MYLRFGNKFPILRFAPFPPTSPPPSFHSSLLLPLTTPKCSHCRIRKSLIVLSWWFNVCFPVSLLSFLCPLLGSRSCLWWPRLIIETTLGAPKLAGWLACYWMSEWMVGDGGKRVFPVLVRPVPLTEGSVCGCLIWWIMRMEQLKIQRSLFLLFFRSLERSESSSMSGWVVVLCGKLRCECETRTTTTSDFIS